MPLPKKRIEDWTQEELEEWVKENVKPRTRCVGFVSIVSEGKTSLFSRIIGAERCKFDVSDRGGSTEIPNIADLSPGLKQPIKVFDLPGLDSLDRNTNSEFLMQQVAEQLDAVVVVVSSSPNQRHKEIFEKLANFEQFKQDPSRVMIALHKMDYLRAAQRRVRVDEMRRQLPDLFKECLIVSTSAAQYDPGLTEEELVDATTDDLQFAEGIETLKEGLRVKATERADADPEALKSILRILFCGSASGGAAGTLTTGIASWSVGMATWGTMSGPVLMVLPAIGTIAAVPLALTLGVGTAAAAVGGVVNYGRHCNQQSKKKNARLLKNRS